MKAVAIILSIIVFVACLVLGIRAGSTPPPGGQPGKTPPSQTIGLSYEKQRTLLLIGVDDLLGAAPRLVSLWVLLYRLDTPRAAAIPLYPLPVSGGNSSFLAETDLSAHFSLTEQHQLNPAFLGALQDFKFAWTGYVMIDQTGSARLIDWMEGIEIQNTTMDGTSAVSTLVDPGVDAGAALASQKQLGESLCQRFSTADPDSNWLALTTDLIPQHLITNLDIEALRADWKALVSSSAPLTCELIAE